MEPSLSSKPKRKPSPSFSNDNCVAFDDLTQTALGMSRDDSGSFLPGYVELDIVKKKSLRTATVRHA